MNVHGEDDEAPEKNIIKYSVVGHHEGDERSLSETCACAPRMSSRVYSPRAVLGKEAANQSTARAVG